ncbi:MAG: hypothetical protein ACFCBW_19005 [Candidatus Competibacterales bacterium]
MPFTPLHLGPGLCGKFLAGRHLSLALFAGTQVAMDLEVGVRLLLGSGQLHGFTNTLPGATVVVLVSVPLGKPLVEKLVGWWNRRLSPGQRPWLALFETLTWPSAWLGGIAGVYSHWFLDALMHRDAQPFWPWSGANPLLPWLSGAQIDDLCLISGLVGAGALGLYGVVVGQYPARSRRDNPLD